MTKLLSIITKNMKVFLTLLILVTSISIFSQSIETIFRKDIDSFYNHSIKDVEVYDNKIFILGSQNDQGSNTTNYVLTVISFDGEIINQVKIKPGKYDFLNDISLNKDRILFAGGMWLKEKEALKDYIMLFDKEFNHKWEMELEEKWEGGIRSVPYKDGFIIATNSNSGVVVYKLNFKGEILEKKSIPTMETDALFKLPNSNFLLASLTLGPEMDSRKELITLSVEFDILNKSVMRMDKKDYLRNTHVPEQIKPLENGKIACLWSGTPPISSFSNPFDTTILSVKHIRHDISFFDIDYFENDIYVYSGRLGKKAAVYLMQDNKILANTVYGNIGTWSKNKIVKVSESEFILINDKIRSNDFESNIEMVRIKIN